MATSLKPSTALARIDPAELPAELTNAKELAALTTAEARALIEAKLPVGITLERVLSEAYFAIQKDAKLQKCTPQSLLSAVVKAVSTGLAIGEKVYLVPFATNVGTREAPRWEQRAQAILDYKGAAELVVRAGGARLVEAKCVFANEPFEYEEGTAPFVKHKPIWDPKKRGELILAYAWAKINAYDVKLLVMSVEEIDAIRQRNSQSWKNGKLGDLQWYAKKTVLRQIVKLLPSTPQLEKIRSDLEAEEVITDAEVEDDRAAAAGEKGDGDAAPLTSARETRLEPSSPAAAADADGVSTDPVDAALDRANNFPLPGGPKSWNGQGGKPLKELSDDHLRAIRAWVPKKLAELEAKGDPENPSLVELVEQLDLVLAARKIAADKAQPNLGLDDDLERQLAASVDATKPAGSGGPVDMPKPGPIAATFSTPKPSPFPKGAVAANDQAAIAKTIDEILLALVDVKDAGKRADIRAKLRSETLTLVEAQRLLKDALLPF